MIKNAVLWARRHPTKMAIGFLALACLEIALLWPVTRAIPTTKAIPIAIPAPVARAKEDAKVEVPNGVEMIFWEEQEWTGGGETSRLTIWADGRSEISLNRLPRRPLKDGWKVVSDHPSWHDVQRQDPFSQDDAKRRFQAALAAGICDLKTFKAGYYDGSGTLIGVQINGNLQLRTIPMFLHPWVKDNQGSLNHRRYLAVQQVMSDFDRDPEEPANAQQQAR